MLLFLVFLIFGFAFWLMLFFQKENVEGTYRFPIKYINIPENVVFDNPLPDFVDISISDNGSEIFKLDVSRKDSIVIDVIELKKSGNTVLQGDQYRQLIKNQLSTSTNIRGYFPMNISLATSELESKELKVTFDGEIITSRANLVAESATFIPETVVAYGSETSLRNLTSAVTEHTIFRNLNATSQLPIKINSIEGVRFSPSEVEIYIPVVEYTEHSFDVPIIASNVPNNLDVKFFPSKATVSFSVTLSEYKKIIPEDFSIIVDYRDFHKNDDGRVTLELTKHPSSIVDPRISPSYVEFLFENKATR